MTRNRAGKRDARQAGMDKYTQARRVTRHDDPAAAAARRNARLAGFLTGRTTTRARWADLAIDARDDSETYFDLPLDFDALLTEGLTGAVVTGRAGAHQRVRWAGTSSWSSTGTPGYAPGAGFTQPADLADLEGASYPAPGELGEGYLVTVEAVATGDPGSVNDRDPAARDALGLTDEQRLLKFHPSYRHGIAIRLTYSNGARLGFLTAPFTTDKASPAWLWEQWLQTPGDAFQALFHALHHESIDVPSADAHTYLARSGWPTQACDSQVITTVALARFHASMAARRLHRLTSMIERLDFSWFDLPLPSLNTSDEDLDALAAEWLSDMWSMGGLGFERHTDLEEMVEWLGSHTAVAAAVHDGFDMSSRVDRERLTTLVPHTWEPRPGPAVHLSVGEWATQRPDPSGRTARDRLRRLARTDTFSAMTLPEVIASACMPWKVRGTVYGAYRTTVVLQHREQWAYLTTRHVHDQAPASEAPASQRLYTTVAWDQADTQARLAMIATAEWVQATTLSDLLVALIRGWDARNYDGINVSDRATMLGWDTDTAYAWHLLTRQSWALVTNTETAPAATEHPELALTVGDVLQGLTPHTAEVEATMLAQTVADTSRDPLTKTMGYLEREHTHALQSAIFDWYFTAAGTYLADRHPTRQPLWDHVQDLAFFLRDVHFRDPARDTSTTPTMRDITALAMRRLDLTDIPAVHRVNRWRHDSDMRDDIAGDTARKAALIDQVLASEAPGSGTHGSSA